LKPLYIYVLVRTVPYYSSFSLCAGRELRARVVACQSLVACHPSVLSLHVVGRWKSCGKWPISIRDAEPKHRGLQQNKSTPHAQFKCP